MRTLLFLVGLVAVVVAILVATGMMSLTVTPGAAPHVALEGGKAPTVSADVARLQIGTEQRAVAVPTVTTTQKVVTVPTITVAKPDPTPCDPPANAN